VLTDSIIHFENISSIFFKYCKYSLTWTAALEIKLRGPRLSADWKSSERYTACRHA